MTLRYLAHGDLVCVLLPSGAAWCRVPIPPTALPPRQDPIVDETCRQCLIELVAAGILPASCDPRRWAAPQRPTRNLRRGAA